MRRGFSLSPVLFEAVNLGCQPWPACSKSAQSNLLAHVRAVNGDGVLHLHQLQPQVIRAIKVWVGNVAHSPTHQTMPLPASKAVLSG